MYKKKVRMLYTRQWRSVFLEIYGFETYIFGKLGFYGPQSYSCSLENFLFAFLSCSVVSRYICGSFVTHNWGKFRSSLFHLIIICGKGKFLCLWNMAFGIYFIMFGCLQSIHRAHNVSINLGHWSSRDLLQHYMHVDGKYSPE